MAMQDSPSARLLGMELRDLRLHRGKTGDQAAATLRCSPSRISRLESGDRPPDHDQLRLLMNLYRVPPGDQDRLRRLRDDGARERLAGDRLDQDIVTELLAWAPSTVPVPLTTELYARAVTASARRVRRYTPSQIKRLARAGTGWQDRLRGDTGGDDRPGLGLTCVLDEAVLRRRRGATSAMAGQLDRLSQLAALPGVTILILPFDVDGPAFGPFTIYSYGNEDLTDTLLLDGPAGAERIIDERVVTDYRYAFEELAAAAADPDTSAALIKQAADSW